MASPISYVSSAQDSASTRRSRTAQAQQSQSQPGGIGSGWVAGARDASALPAQRTRLTDAKCRLPKAGGALGKLLAAGKLLGALMRHLPLIGRLLTAMLGKKL